MVQPFLARVLPLPFVSPLVGFAEAASSSDTFHSPLEISLLKLEARVLQRGVGSDAPHHVVEGGGDVAWWVEDMPVQRQQPVWPQQLCRLAGAQHWVDPVPGLSGDNGIERTTARVPGFEIADLDLDAAAPGDIGHPRVRVDAEYRATGRLVLPCPDAGAAADVQEVHAGTRGDDTLARSRPVVPFGVHLRRTPRRSGSVGTVRVYVLPLPAIDPEAPRKCNYRRVSREGARCVGPPWQSAVVGRSTPFVGTEAVVAGEWTERELRRSCTRIYRNVYQRRGSDLTAKHRAVAAWLWSGKSAVVAGNSAAALLGAGWVDAHAPAELITDRKRPPRLIVTRNETLLAGEVTAVEGVAVTSPARTVFDLGRRPGLLTAVIAIDSLARATGLTVDDVEPIIEAHRGARGLKQLRRVLPLIDAGAESPQETRTRLVLMAGGLPRPETQIVVRNGWGAVLARIDMGWEEWLVGVEYDGAQHWTDPRIRANDIDRTAELERRGWRLVRVSADLLRNRPDIVVDRVRGALSAAGYRESATVDAFPEWHRR